MTKQLNRQIGLAFFHGIFGPILLFGTLGSFEPSDGSRYYVMLTISVTLMLLLALAVIRAVRTTRRRAAEN